MTLVVGLLGTLASACMFPQSTGVDAMLAESPRGAVFLQKAEDGWFRTAHPLDLSPVVLATVFRGVRVLALPTNTAVDDRVFSDEDTAFLSPLISTALSKATKSQVVGFRVVHDTDAGQETTGGILYVQGRLLHLTFTHYRAQHEGADQDGAPRRLVPNPTRLDKRQVDFIPESAKRSSRNEQPDVIATPPLASLVLDYETLTVGPTRSSTPIESRPSDPDAMPVSQPPAQSAHPTTDATHGYDPPTARVDEGRGVQAPVTETETEIKSLKEEMRRLQRRLDDLDRARPRPTMP